MTKALRDDRELKFEAFASVGHTGVIKNLGRFSKCSVTINYQQRR